MMRTMMMICLLKAMGDDEGTHESNNLSSSQAVGIQSTTVRATERRATHQADDEYLSDEDEFSE